MLISCPFLKLWVPNISKNSKFDLSCAGFLIVSRVRCGEVRTAFFKESRERFLGFGGTDARREFLVLELYRALE